MPWGSAMSIRSVQVWLCAGALATIGLASMPLGAQAPSAAPSKPYSRAAHAVGRPRPAGQLHQHLRERHAARAARAVRRPQSRGHQGRGASRASRTPIAGADHRGVQRPDPRARQLVAAGARPRQGRAGLAGRGSAGRQDSAAHARGAAAHRGGRAPRARRAAAARPTRGPTAASTTAASRAACPAR